MREREREDECGPKGSILIPQVERRVESSNRTREESPHRSHVITSFHHVSFPASRPRFPSRPYVLPIGYAHRGFPRRAPFVQWNDRLLAPARVITVSPSDVLTARTRNEVCHSARVREAYSRDREYENSRIERTVRKTGTGEIVRSILLFS